MFFRRKISVVGLAGTFSSNSVSAIDELWRIAFEREKLFEIKNVDEIRGKFRSQLFVALLVFCKEVSELPKVSSVATYFAKKLDEDPKLYGYIMRDSDYAELSSAWVDWLAARLKTAQLEYGEPLGSQLMRQSVGERSLLVEEGFAFMPFALSVIVGLIGEEAASNLERPIANFVAEVASEIGAMSETARKFHLVFD